MLAWVISTAAVALVAPASATSDYPIEAVWAEQQAFCAQPYEQHASWEVFEPEPNSSFNWLRMLGTQRRGPKNEIRFPAYRKQIAGRTLFGFKASFERNGGGRPIIYCNVYDFDTQSKLDGEAWTKVLGAPVYVRVGEGYQRIELDSDGFSGSDLFVTLQTPELFPVPDSVGFNGLEIRKITKEIE